MLILSICIPTYHRSALLAEALKAIVEQLDERLRPFVEVIISDNCSPDDTPTLVQRFMAEYPKVQWVYHRQSQNMGTDANINTLVGLARATHMVLLSDDDILLPGAIARIVDALQAHPALNAIVLNMRTFQRSVDEPSAAIFPLAADIELVGRDATLAFLGTWITFLSCLAFSRAALARDGYADKVGTLFLQSYVFLDALTPDGGVLVTHEPYLAIRGNNTGGYNFFDIFVTHFAQVMGHSQRIGYAPSAVREALRKHEKFLFGFVVAFKLRGSYGSLRPDYWDGVRRLVSVYRFDPLFLLKTVPLMMLPGQVVRAARVLYRFVRGKKPA